MYLFIYKTSHKNGRFYIGRHQTQLLEDGYLGSGKWVNSIKNRDNLSRQILKYADSIEQLYKFEEYYINLYWEDPLCMNMIKGSNGWNSYDAGIMGKMGGQYTKIRIQEGNHPFLKREDGSSISSDKVKNGTHPFLKGSKQYFRNLQRNKNLIENGTHPFTKRNDGTSVSSDKVREGTHNFLTKEDGSNLQTDRVKKGTHHFQNSIACRNRLGEYKLISKETYYSQHEIDSEKEWVIALSKEGRKRKLIWDGMKIPLETVTDLVV